MDTVAILIYAAVVAITLLVAWQLSREAPAGPLPETPGPGLGMDGGEGFARGSVGSGGAAPAVDYACPAGSSCAGAALTSFGYGMGTSRARGAAALDAAGLGAELADLPGVFSGLATPRRAAIRRDLALGVRGPLFFKTRSACEAALGTPMGSAAGGSTGGNTSYLQTGDPAMQRSRNPVNDGGGCLEVRYPAVPPGAGAAGRVGAAGVATDGGSAISTLAWGIQPGAEGSTPGHPAPGYESYFVPKDTFFRRSRPALV